ncbi:MAG: MFS transporter [Coriobacteriales bacterium]|jgi:putative MFS transporter|nr:MFS transporter [Coriobacteriales bacterium]
MSISERLDRLPATPLLRKIIVIAGLGLMFDAMDQGMVAGVNAAVSVDWALSAFQQGFLLNSGLIGMLLGALISGLAADRWGRRTVVLVTLLVFSAGSFLCGLAPTFELLLVFRFITGIGLGGELPVITTMVSEFSSLKNRGRNVVVVESFWAWGWILAALVAFLVIPLDGFGWRAAFFIGAVPALFAAALRFLIPESPRFLEQKGRLEEAEGVVGAMERSAGIEMAARETQAPAPAPAPAPSSVATAIASALNAFVSLWKKEYRRSTVVLWVLWFGVNLGYYGFVLWMPKFFVAQDYGLASAFMVVLIMSLAQLPGYLTAAILIEKIGRKPVLLIFLVGFACAAWFFGHANSQGLVLLFGCLMYFFALGTWGCIYSYTPELYPTAIRTSGAGAASAFGRIGAIIGPLIVPTMYAFFGEANGFELVFAVLAAVFLLVALVVALLGKETKGKVIQEAE